MGKTSIFGYILQKLEFKAKVPLQKKIHICNPNLQKLTKIKKKVPFFVVILVIQCFVLILIIEKHKATTRSGERTIYCTEAVYYLLGRG